MNAKYKPRRTATIAFHRGPNRVILTNPWMLCTVTALLVGFEYSMYATGLSGHAVFVWPTVFLVIGFFCAIPYTLYNVIASWRRDEADQAVAATRSLAVLGILFGLLMAIPARGLLERGLAQRLDPGGKLECMQEWVASIAHRTDLVGRRWSSGYAPRQLPACFAAADPEMVIAVPGPDETALVEVVWGGGFEHFGLLIGPPTLKTTPRYRLDLTEWRPGVYLFVE